MYDSAKADRTVKFFNQLKHTKSPWKGVPFELLNWQDEIIREVFGTVKENGYRQYNKAYVEVPKKNGKSELAAGIGLYLLSADNEWGAEVYGCATDKGQASIVFDVAADMVDQNKALKKRVKPVFSKKRLIYMPTKSYYQVLSADAYTKHGFNVHGCIFDELHAQPKRDFWDVMTDGSGDARMQPLFFVITTAGDDPDRTSIGWEVHQQALDVINKKIVLPNFYAKIYGLNENADWENEENWKKVNPSLGITIQMDSFKNAYLEAKANPAKEKTFRWLRLNQWLKTTKTNWLPLDIYDKNKSVTRRPYKSNGQYNIIKELKGRKCFEGLDLSSKLDISAFLLMFPPEDNKGKFKLLLYPFIPEENMKERVKYDKVPYDIWEKQGWLKTTPGNIIDYKFIEKTIIDLREYYEYEELGYDSWNAAQTAIRLEEYDIVCAPVRQGYQSMSPPMKEVEALIKAGKVDHGNNPILRWMFGNVEVKQDENENIRPVKAKNKKSGKRIDGFVAWLNAMNRYLLTKNDEESIYETRGVRG